MHTLVSDFRHGVRLLAKHPGFTLVAVSTLAIGIASTTTVFSWIDTILLRPFPAVPAADGLAALELVTAGAPSGATRLAYREYQDFRDHMKTTAGMAARQEQVFSAGYVADGKPVWGEAVSSNYFDVLGVRPWIGNAFSTQQCGDSAGTCPVVVVSYSFWRDRLGGQPASLGKTLRVNRRELTVIGVTPPDFRGTVTGLRSDLWVPLTMSAELGLGAKTLTDRGVRGLDVLLRLPPRVAIAECRAEAEATARQLAVMYPTTNRNVSATVVSVGEMRSGAAALLRLPLRILMAVSLLVLLIVCANLANLLLARSVSRMRELSLRLALGAGRWRLAGMLIGETLPLAVAGLSAGLPLAFWMADLLPALVPQIGVPLAVEVTPDSRILAFSASAALVVVLLSTLAPLLLSLRADVNTTLKEGGRGMLQGRQSFRTQSLLVMSQVALASVSLVTAVLFLQSFRNARGIHPGFDRDNVLLARFYVSASRYSPEQMHQFFRNLSDRVTSAPGVLSAGYGDYAPLGSNAGPYTTVQVEGYTPQKEDLMMVSENLIAPGYLDTLGIPLVEGRGFNDRDTPDRPPVLIVSQAFARKFYGAASPLGRRVFAWGKWRTIVGMARDSKHFDPAESAVPYFYSPMIYSRNSSANVYFVVRTTGDPQTAIPILRREAMALDPDAMAMQPMPLKEWTDVTLLPQKLAARLMSALGLIALLLAAAGLYATMAYAVAQRTREIGIRMALGASMRAVLNRVLGQGLRGTVIGLAVGLLGAAAAARFIQSMLVQVSAWDPLAFGATAGFLALVALAACAAPAWKAARIDPLHALREE
ncbi:MAG: ABC transporter permease [Bryobacterales bacterium]|nr:ABC transporter permease [Bryobacterales bacterium]